MNIFMSQLHKYQRIIITVILLAFACAFLHLQNFDPTHPTLVNSSCIQGLPQCASYRDSFISIVNLLLFFSGLYVLLHISRKALCLSIEIYMEDYMYIPILYDSIRIGLRRGILHSKCH
jgi:hypothetical protein